MTLDMDKDVLFLGRGKGAVCWYRCALPAAFLGADWAGVYGAPPNSKLLTGSVRGGTTLPVLNDYKVIVVQQPAGPEWLKVIQAQQARGAKVVFEVDDYLHAIPKMDDHDFADNFDTTILKGIELCMRACDAVIVSTEFIAKRYRKFNPNIHVCENGIDPSRYDMTIPQRDTVNIGWAGATAHFNALTPWMQVVARVMADRSNTKFITIGQPYADGFKSTFGDRALSVPFTLLDIYPAAMTNLDIALAPAGKNNFFLGKSDLRWLEAGALGIPIIADPTVYSRIIPWVTGFHASSQEEVYEALITLIDSPDLRTTVGENARDYVMSRRTMVDACEQWREVLEAL